MRQQPPFAARLCLRAIAPAHELPHLEGDLQEEFYSYILPARGPRAASLWYWRQVLGSFAPLFRREVSSSNWQISLALIFLAAAGAGFVLDRFWSAILACVPLKMDLARGPVYTAAHLSLTLVLSWIAGLTCRICVLPLAMGAASLFSALGSAALLGIQPRWFFPAQAACVLFGIVAGLATSTAAHRRLAS